MSRERQQVKYSLNDFLSPLTFLPFLPFLHNSAVLKRLEVTTISVTAPKSGFEIVATRVCQICGNKMYALLQAREFRHSQSCHTLPSIIKSEV